MHAADLLTGRARLTPDREALYELHSNRRYTYNELNRRANRAANFLREQLGVHQGDRVSILAQNGVVYLDLFYGLAKIGAILAPLNWRLVAAELAYILNDCGSTVLLCGPEFVDILTEMRPQLNVKHILSLDGADIEDAISYEERLATAPDSEPERPDLDGKSPHCILYTSGTTGRPKGAIIPHGQVVWNCINTVSSWGLTELDVSPVFTPMFHAGGLFAFLAPLFYIGGRIVLGRDFDVAESLRVIQEERCTVILGVPTLFQMWLDAEEFAEADFSHVHFFISGGAPCPVPLIEAWREKTNSIFRQGYGLTEVGPNCFSMTDEEAALKAGSVGKPIFHSKMRLVDETGKDVPIGETGELLIFGPHVCAGYWHNPEATSNAIVNGWFHTGDMARMDDDGFYTIAGRFKDMIISGGENVYAAEVEAVFLEHPAVAECALIGMPHEKWGEVGLMIVVQKNGASTTEVDLQDHCQDQLARYKVPKKVIFVDSLPHSPYGKVEKAKLRERYLLREGSIDMNMPTLEGITAMTVTTSRLKSRVLFSGPANGRPVLFLHGNLSSATWWEEVMVTLPDGCRGIAPDQRGFGGADPDKKIDATRGMGDLADDIVALLDHLDIEKAHVIGNSMGGNVAWRLLADYPDRLKTVTQVDPGSPFGFGCTKDVDGTPCFDDFAGSGAGLINPELLKLLNAGDRTLDSQFSPRAALRMLVYKPPFIPKREEELLWAALSIHLGEQDYPGDMDPSPNWPFVAPGKWGINNALSPKYAGDMEALYTAGPKPSILWLRGSHDLAVSDTSASDPGTLGAMGLIPGWPGAEIYPSQPMLGQIRAVLDKYAAGGGSYQEIVLEEAGHAPYLEQLEAFNEAFHEHIND